MSGVEVCWCMGQKRRSAKRKWLGISCSLRNCHLQLAAAYGQYECHQASVQCKWMVKAQKEHMGAVFKTFTHGWRASLHKGRSDWELKTLKLTRVGVEKALVYLSNKWPGLRDHLAPFVLPLHLWRCKWKKDYIFILGAGIFLTGSFYCYWKMSRWHFSDLSTIPVWLLSHKWGWTVQLQHLSAGS